MNLKEFYEEYYKNEEEDDDDSPYNSEENKEVKEYDKTSRISQKQKDALVRDYYEKKNRLKHIGFILAEVLSFQLLNEGYIDKNDLE